MTQRRYGDAGAQTNARSARRRSGEHHRWVGNQSSVTQEVMLVEHETFPAQRFRQLDLLQNLLIVDIIGRIAIRKVSRQYVHVEAHRLSADSPKVDLRARPPAATDEPLPQWPASPFGPVFIAKDDRK